MAPLPDDKQANWREVLERQKLANATRWLTILDGQPDPSHTVIQDYDNLLRALETALQKEASFDLAFQLIEKLFPIVFGYADWERWLIYLAQAVTLSQQVHKKYEEAALISYQGNIYTHMGDYLKAKEIYHECLQQYEALSDKGNYAITLTKLANVADLQGNISESLNLLKEARNVSNATGNKLTLAMIDLSLSSVYYKAREWASGLAAAQSAQVLAYELHKPQIETMALLNIILFHTELRNWQKADILAHDLEQRLDTSGDLVKLSQLKNTRGIAAYHQGHYLEAEKAWQETLKINSQINQTSELANSYNNLGMVYTKLNELNTASSMLLNAARIYKDNGDIFNWANALDNLAEVYERQGNKIMARDVLCMALLDLTETDNKPYSEGLLTIIKERIEALTLSNFR